MRADPFWSQRLIAGAGFTGFAFPAHMRTGPFWLAACALSRALYSSNVPWNGVAAVSVTQQHVRPPLVFLLVDEATKGTKKSLLYAGGRKSSRQLMPDANPPN